MDVAAVTATGPAASSDSGATLPGSDAAVFEKMVQGVLTAGLSLMNSMVGDTIDALNEPFGDPDQ